MNEAIEWFIANPWACVLGVMVTAALQRICVGMGYEEWGLPPQSGVTRWWKAHPHD